MPQHDLKLPDEQIFNKFDVFEQCVTIIEKVKPEYKNREEVYNHAEAIFFFKFGCWAYDNFMSYKTAKKRYLERFLKK